MKNTCTNFAYELEKLYKSRKKISESKYVRFKQILGRVYEDEIINHMMEMPYHLYVFKQALIRFKHDADKFLGAVENNMIFNNGSFEIKLILLIK